VIRSYWGGFKQRVACSFWHFKQKAVGTTEAEKLLHYTLSS